MPSCVIKRCTNNSCSQKKDAGITFHKFPGDKKWKEKWIKNVRDNRNDDKWLPSKSSVVCSVHFEEIDMYDTKGGYRRINKNASPKKILLVDSEWCQETQAGSPTNDPLEPIEHCNAGEEVEAAGTSDKLTQDISKNQQEILDFSTDSEIDAMFDTPEKHKLRQQARKYKLYYQNHVRKIKLLNQKVRRLKKRNSYLKRVLIDLKDKNKKLIQNKGIN